MKLDECRMSAEIKILNEAPLSDLIYIMSPSYSGSTLLTMMMAAHPAIATIGELKATAMGDVDRYQCSCGSLIRECGFWRKIGAEMMARKLPFTLENYGTHFRADSYFCDRLLHAAVRGRWFEAGRELLFRWSSPCRAKRDSILRQNLALIEVIARIQGGQAFLDGSKDPVRLKHLMQVPWRRVRVISLVRDGRGVTCSYMRHEQHTMEGALKEWLHTVREMEALGRLLKPTEHLVVRYEDLCRDHVQVLEQIYRFIGLEPSEAAPDFSRVEHHILGNNMRTKKIEQVRLDERWKTELISSDLAKFESQAGAINRRFGYI
ncbi:MAG: sulfotransferase [Pseudomonadota bacterium]